jgi:hypothetical protein
MDKRSQSRSVDAKEIVAKRGLDLLVAGTVLVMLSPLLALICLGIKLEGRSPSILLQRRTAFNGCEFVVYNFTTTAWDGECIRQARRNDSRVTRVGRLLRAAFVSGAQTAYEMIVLRVPRAQGAAQSVAAASSGPVYRRHLSARYRVAEPLCGGLVAAAVRCVRLV